MIQHVEQAGQPVQSLVLTPLHRDSVMQMLADVLHRAAAKLVELAELITQKTGGNPFFISEFLRALYVKELITFDAQHKQWVWDVAGIHAEQMTDNVAYLLTDKIQQLAPQSQQILQRAACIGHQFSLETLARIAELPPTEAARQLEPALQAGLILPRSDAYLLMTSDVPGLAEQMSAEYAFAHDRIQQAVYDLIAPEQQGLLHWQIGQVLWLTLPEARLEEQIFEVVEHLNQGRSEIANAAQALAVAALNRQAARRAQQSAAFHASFNYCAAGIALLPEDAWQTDYDLALDLYTRYAQAAYLTGDQETQRDATNTVLDYARSVLDTVEIYEITLQAYAARQQFREAIGTVRPVLAQLGVELPEQPSQRIWAAAYKPSKCSSVSVTSRRSLRCH